MNNIAYLCNMNKEQIATTLKKRRKELGLTLNDLSAIVGDKQQLISRIENGANTNIDKLVKYCNALSLEVTVKPFGTFPTEH